MSTAPSSKWSYCLDWTGTCIHTHKHTYLNKISLFICLLTTIFTLLFVVYHQFHKVTGFFVFFFEKYTGSIVKLFQTVIIRYEHTNEFSTLLFSWWLTYCFDRIHMRPKIFSDKRFHRATAVAANVPQPIGWHHTWNQLWGWETPFSRQLH